MERKNNLKRYILYDSIYIITFLKIQLWEWRTGLWLTGVKKRVGQERSGYG